MDDLETNLKALLVARKGHWADIVQETKVSHSWLSKFLNGHIPNPGYAQMRRVHAYLTAGNATKRPRRVSA